MGAFGGIFVKYALVVIIDRYCHHFFGLLLADDIFVQTAFYLVRGGNVFYVKGRRRRFCGFFLDPLFLRDLRAGKFDVGKIA